MEERMDGLEQGQRDTLDAMRSQADALSQVSQGLGTLNDRLAAAPPAHGNPANQPQGQPQAGDPPRAAPPAVQPVAAPMPGEPAAPQASARRRKYA